MQTSSWVGGWMDDWDTRRSCPERAERAERAKRAVLLEELRAELLCARHSFRLTSGYKRWRHEMSLKLCNSNGLYLSVGDNEQFFQVLIDHSNIGESKAIELDRVIKKAEKNRQLCEYVATIMSKSGTQVSVNEQLQSLEYLFAFFPNSVSSELESAFNVTIVSAVVLLYFVYQYLMGYLDRGGPKTYSSGSLDFRDIYISIVLFQGAYVWIKFRQAARFSSLKRKSCETQDVQVGDESDLKGVYPRPMKDKMGAFTHYKYEPRFKPPREKLDSGITLQFNYLPLGRYNTRSEASIVYQIAAFYYGRKDEGRLALEDGSFFSIPPMSKQERSFSGEEKRKWVTLKAKKVFEDFQKEKATLKLRRVSETGALLGHGSDGGSDPSPSAGAVTCSFRTSSRNADERVEIPLVSLVQLAPSHGDNGAEQHVVSVPGSSTNEPIPAIEHVSGVNCSGVQDNVLGKETDARESVDHDKILGHADDHSDTLCGYEDMIAELLFDEFTNIPPQLSSFPDNQMHDWGVPEILGVHSPPQSDAATQLFAFVVPKLNPNLESQQGWDFVGAVPEAIVTSGSSLFVKERDSVLGQVNHLQQLVSRQKKLLEDAAIRNVDLQHQLSESEVKNSELRREKSVLQQENEHLRAILQQVAKSQVATWSGIIIDFQQEEGR